MNSAHRFEAAYDKLSCLKNLLKFSCFLFQMFLNHSFWTDDGCKMVSVEDSNVTCECEHLTSFAVIMQIVPV